MLPVLGGLGLRVYVGFRVYVAGFRVHVGLGLGFM